MSSKDFKPEIHQDDIGTRFEVTIVDPQTNRPVNIAAATETLLYFLRPEIDAETPAERLDKIATFTTDGTDGRVEYKSIAGDLSVTGIWKLQAKVTTPDGAWHSEILKFRVVPNL